MRPRVRPFLRKSSVNNRHVRQGANPRASGVSVDSRREARFAIAEPRRCRRGTPTPPRLAHDGAAAGRRAACAAELRRWQRSAVGGGAGAAQPCAAGGAPTARAQGKVAPHTSKASWLSPRPAGGSPEACLSASARIGRPGPACRLGRAPVIPGVLCSTKAALRPLLARRAALRVRRAARAGAAAARAARLHRRPAARARQPGKQRQATSRRLPGQRSLGGKRDRVEAGSCSRSSCSTGR